MARGALLLALLLVAGCLRAPAPPSPPPGAGRDVADPADPTVAPAPVTADAALRPVPAGELPLLLDDGERDALAQAVTRSLGWYRRQPAARVFVAGPRPVTAGAMADALARLHGWLEAGISAERLAAEAAYAFDVYESVGGAGGRSGEMLVTGYYEPILDASFERRPGYDTPLYRPPGGLVRVDLGAFSDELAGKRIVGRLVGDRLEPYPDRREIRERGVLRGRELAWARDPVDAFFLEIQGSGSLRLPDGRLVRVGYAGANGRSYRSIGKLLIDEGKVPREAMSMQAIRAYLEARPEERERIFDHNPSTVFFRRLDGPPLGSLGVPVTPGRSIATDRRLFPPGALAFLISEVPRLAADGTTEVEKPLRRFVLNQDTGGAIRGPARVDFFWGRGAEAGERAGAMKQPGRLLFLLPAAR